MNGKNPKQSSPHSCVDFTAAVLGNTSSAPTIPADGPIDPTKGQYPLRANRAASATHSATGVIVITLADPPATMLYVSAQVIAAGGSPTAELIAVVTKIDPANKQVTVKTMIPAGTATDPGTSDMIVLYCHGQDSTV